MKLINQLFGLHREMRSFPIDRQTNPYFEKLTERVNALYRQAKTPIEKDLALIAKVGGQMELKDLSPGLKRFLKSNHFHHAFQALKLPVKTGGAIPINGEWIPFDDLQVTTHDNKTIYSHSGKTCFEARKDGRLTKDYTLTKDGIIQYNSWVGQSLIPFDRRDPKDWNYENKMEIWTATSHEQGEGVGGFSNQHAYTVIKTKSGDIYSIGKYGPFDSLECADYVQPGGIKVGYLMSPDEYSYHAADASNYEVKEITLSDDQLKKVMSRYKRDKANGASTFAYLTDNCNSYIESVLHDELGLKVSSKIELVVYFAGLLPPWIRKPFQVIHDLLPEWANEGIRLFFLPLHYLASTFSGLFAFAVSRMNHEGFPGDAVNLKDVFTMNVTLDHPVALRKSLRQIT